MQVCAAGTRRAIARGGALPAHGYDGAPLAHERKFINSSRIAQGIMSREQWFNSGRVSEFSNRNRPSKSAERRARRSKWKDRVTSRDWDGWWWDRCSWVVCSQGAKSFPLRILGTIQKMARHLETGCLYL